MWIHKGLLILWLETLESVGVPMVFQFGADIHKWNAKVLDYVVSVFIFVNNLLSQSDAIFLFRLEDLQILK
jgi:hypothetical protein